MKKCIAFLTSLLMIASSCAFSVTADEMSDELTGDVNFDGAVTSADMAMLLDCFFGANYDIARSDVNNDGDTNVLDVIILKKMLLNGSLDDEVGQTHVQADKTETGVLNFDYSNIDQINQKVIKTATYVDSYEKMTDFISKLDEYKIKTNTLSEKYNKDFFTDHSVVICISSTLSRPAEIESITAHNGVLTINALGYEEPLPLPVVSFEGLEFTKEDLSSYNITAAEYKPTNISVYNSDSGLDIYCEKASIIEETGWYKWINSSQELSKLLDSPSVYFENDESKDNLCNVFNNEFFKTNSLLLYNGMLDCPDVSAVCDEKVINVSILADVSDTNQLLFIAMPTEAGADKKTIIKCKYRQYPEKPVIYLYPQKETEVSVSVDLNGRFSCVYPEFTDKDKNTWKVTTSPDGLLRTDDGSEYNYLFWEGIQDVDWDMSKGFVVKGSDTLSFLRNQLPKIGLTPKEYNDFIVYWLPQMQNNEYNYITFQTDKYTDNAVLKVTPDADSVLRVFIAYTPVNKEEAQILSQSVNEPKFNGFERNGFTVVEWGGCIIH